jgi:hypothetical protein
MRRAVLLVALLALCVAPAGAAYTWPLKPFRKAHAIRGYFGDPRTVFQGTFDPDGIDSEGAFSFHNGVDISAVPGQAVYPVTSGVARVPNMTTVVVRSSNHRTFKYQHLAPDVYDGQRVFARRTVLGHVDAVAGHVHLSEIDRTVVVNPLQRGHLSPYRDTTVPKVESVMLRTARGRELKGRGLTGDVEIVAEAYDMPNLPVPGSWFGYPVAPALVLWSMTNEQGAFVVLPTVVADFRFTLPPRRDFWRVYARGTYQNKPRFGWQQFLTLPGRFEFKLTHSPLDTNRLPDGAYLIRVTVEDTAGNSSTREQPITICNADPSSCTPPPAP